MIKHLSKWLKLVPLPDCSSEGATYAFLDMILSKFRAPTEVLINQGTYFCGEFQELCEKALINHRMISQDHLEVDGLAKQIVQMVKWGLQKYGLHKGHNQDWDLNYHG